MACSQLHALSRETMNCLETKYHVKQEPLMLMKRKKQEDEEEATSTELSLCLDYQPIKKKSTIFTDDHVINHGDEKDEFFETNDRVSSTGRQGSLTTRDFFLEVTKINNNADAVVAVTDSSSNTSVSTELELYCDPWNIKKRLTKSDLNDLSRLLIPTRSVKKHVLPFMRDDAVEQVETGDGLRVSVWDLDTDSVHQLVFKKWRFSSKAYILSLKWNKEFVERRNLKKGDEIGLWDHHHSRFGFRVLDRIND